jgi:hypothetical protein
VYGSSGEREKGTKVMRQSVKESKDGWNIRRRL